MYTIIWLAFAVYFWVTADKGMKFLTFIIIAWITIAMTLYSK